MHVRVGPIGKDPGRSYQAPAACEPLAGSSVSGIEKQKGMGRSLEWVVAGS